MIVYFTIHYIFTITSQVDSIKTESWSTIQLDCISAKAQVMSAITIY